MPDRSNAPLTPGTQPRPPSARGALQYLLALLVLALVGVEWHYADGFVRLLAIEAVAPMTGLCFVAGSAALLLGTARHLLDGRSGTYALLLAALLLAGAAFSVGNWDYLVGKIHCAIGGAGAVLALWGAWLAQRR